MKTSTKLIISFAVGQITQLVMQGVVVSLNMWDSKRVLFCGAAGFVILFAVIMGVRISAKEAEFYDEIDEVGQEVRNGKD